MDVHEEMYELQQAQIRERLAVTDLIDVRGFDDNTGNRILARLRQHQEQDMERLRDGEPRHNYNIEHIIHEVVNEIIQLPPIPQSPPPQVPPAPARPRGALRADAINQVLIDVPQADHRPVPRGLQARLRNLRVANQQQNVAAVQEARVNRLLERVARPPEGMALNQQQLQVRVGGRVNVNLGGNYVINIGADPSLPSVDKILRRTQALHGDFPGAFLANSRDISCMIGVKWTERNMPNITEGTRVMYGGIMAFGDLGEDLPQDDREILPIVHKFSEEMNPRNMETIVSVSLAQYYYLLGQGHVAPTGEVLMNRNDEVRLTERFYNEVQDYANQNNTPIIHIWDVNRDVQGQIVPGYVAHNGAFNANTNYYFSPSAANLGHRRQLLCS